MAQRKITTERKQQRKTKCERRWNGIVYGSDSFRCCPAQLVQRIKQKFTLSIENVVDDIVSKLIVTADWMGDKSVVWANFQSSAHTIDEHVLVD